VNNDTQKAHDGGEMIEAHEGMQRRGDK